MLEVSFDAQGPVPYKSIVEGHTVKEEMYIEIFHCFCYVFRRKCTENWA
jgi:hypothetical protein